MGGIFILDLDHLGVQFVVLPNHFVIFMPQLTLLPSI